MFEGAARKCAESHSSVQTFLLCVKSNLAKNLRAAAFPITFVLSSRGTARGNRVLRTDVRIVGGSNLVDDATLGHTAGLVSAQLLQ